MRILFVTGVVSRLTRGVTPPFLSTITKLLTTMVTFKTTFSLLPADYKKPVGSDIYLKMAKAGSPIRFIIVGGIVTGFSYWTADKQCIRSREKPTETPNIKVDDKGKVDRVSHFWTMPVYDVVTETVKLLEITQRGLQDQLFEIFNGNDYDLGDLTSPMAIKISATGEQLLTKYTLMPIPSTVPDLMDRLAASDLASSDLDEIVFATPSKPSAPAPAADPNATPPKPVIAVATAKDMM